MQPTHADPETRLRDLIELTQSLSEIFAQENALLATRRAQAIAPLQAEKARLAAAYAQSIRDVATNRSSFEGASEGCSANCAASQRRSRNAPPISVRSWMARNERAKAWSKRSQQKRRKEIRTAPPQMAAPMIAPAPARQSPLIIGPENADPDPIFSLSPSKTRHICVISFILGRMGP